MSEGHSSNGVENAGSSTESSEMNVYKKEACKVVLFKFVYDEDDLESENAVTFKPEMAHQLFGESESIFGYRSLSITLNYLHNSSRCYVDLVSSGKIQNENMKPDDIAKSLESWLPADLTQSLDDFTDWLGNEEHDKMFGEVVAIFEDSEEMSRFPENQIKATYKITKNDTTDTDFTDVHSRFQTFIVWFIDAANYIDLEDDRWLIYYVYEQFVHPEKKTIYRSPVGFCTVYNFYAFPSNIRPRISQFFILPSHQKRGIGTKLYETVAKDLRAMESVVDITVEEPTTSFQKIRDLDDCLLLHKKLVETNTTLYTTSSKKVFELAKNLKICRRQVQRVYDILGLYYASEKGPLEYKKLLEYIKNRFIEASEREARPGKRFCNIHRESVSISVDQKAQVETEYKKHIDDIGHSVKYLQSKLRGRLENAH